MHQAPRELTLKNGLTVRFSHQARRYFGDYHEITLAVRCQVPVTPGMFEDESAFRAAMALLGKTVCYLRTEKQMGVPTCEVEGCVESLISRFSATTLAYFEAPTFPKKLVHAEIKRLTTPRRAHIPMFAHG